MAKPTAGLYTFATQVFFSAALAPLFLSRKFAEAALTRRAIAYFFGRLLARRYHRIVQFYGTAYGAALAMGLEEAARVCTVAIKQVIDCGTGTGFAARQASARFPQATVVGVDRVPHMLEQARQSFLGSEARMLALCADTLSLPLHDAAVNVVVAQNTVPFLGEFARVCRPGGVVVFVDTAARWIAPLARRAARRTGYFDVIVAEPAGLGFYLVARRGQ